MDSFLAMVIGYWVICLIVLFVISMSEDSVAATLGPVFGFAIALIFFAHSVDIMFDFSEYLDEKIGKPEIARSELLKYQDNEGFTFEDVYNIKEQIGWERDELTRQRLVFEEALREQREDRLGLAMDVQFTEAHINSLIRKYNKWQLHWNGFLIGDPVFEELLIS